LKKAFKLLITKIFVSQTNKILTKYNPKIIVVVGSIGKTSTKLAIAKILAKKFRVQVEEGNYNVPLSVPFVLTGQRLPSLLSIPGWIRAYRKGQKILKDDFNYDVVVFEYSIDHVGEMDEFKVFPSADFVVVSAIAPEHMENLYDIETVAKEELKATYFSKNIIFNSNTVKKRYIEKYGNKKATYESYGENNSSDFMQKKTTKQGRYELELIQNKSIIASSDTQMIAEHSLDALSAGAIIANKLGISIDEINSAISEITNPAGRMNTLMGKQGSLIIDDSYNASPEATIAALDALYEVHGTKKIAILGNMNELGDYSQEAHELVGSYCDPKKLDLVITIGPDANKFLAEAAQERGCKVVTANSPVEAGEIVLKTLIANSVVLVKGSQNKVYAEEAIKTLLANPEDSYKLVRQSESWLNIKRNQFPDIS
jgi:UDP-N-acetylmuramoyl-tripeptide--D-alanyl-D-alanine ligase